MPPEEVLLLLGDLRQRVPVAKLPELLHVPLGEGDVSGHAAALDT